MDSAQQPATRRAVRNSVLTAIAGTTWAEHLVLHGSVTMAARFGKGAREPNDIDYVVTPDTVTDVSPTGVQLLRDLKRALRHVDGADQRREITDSTLWDYERADGRRLVVPFSTPDFPDGRVQIDFVFGDRLLFPPEDLVVPGVDQPLLAVPAKQLLAWKLMWLVSGPFAEGKDLYDAALLAEYTTVDLAVVRDLIRLAEAARARARSGLEFTLRTAVSWRPPNE